MSHNRKISVIGLGYVGLPVAVAFGRQNQIIGFDINEERIRELSEGYDNTNEVLARDLDDVDILFTSNSADLAQADFHIVAVPTPVNAAKQPDLSPLLNASRTLGPVLKRGDIVVYESTVYPGATEEDCLPILEALSGLSSGKDFHVGYSPERINPGDKEHTFSTIKKVVSAQDEPSLEIVAQVYGSVVKAGIHRAPTIKVAEAAKVIENTQRDINISLMNELALIFEKLDIDTGDVLETAGTKWNFMPFRPGLVGGHCIGVDPYYLTHKASISGYTPQVILAGRSINDGMGAFVASQIVKALINKGNGVKGSVITILGFTFKENVPDTRNTRVIDIVNALNEYDIKLQIFDPHANINEVKDEYGVQLMNREDIECADAIILAVAHTEFVENNWSLVKDGLKKGKGVVFDVNRILDRDRIPQGITLLRL